jgi:hypothetical protein
MRLTDISSRRPRQLPSRNETNVVRRGSTGRPRDRRRPATASVARKTAGATSVAIATTTSTTGGSITAR